MKDTFVSVSREAAEVAETHSSMASKVLNYAKSLQVNSSEMYAFVDEKLGLIAQKKNKAETERDEIAVPAYTAYKNARKWFQPAIEIYDSAMAIIRDKMDHFREEDKRRVEEEERKAREDAEAERRKERQKLEDERRKEAEATAKRDQEREEERKLEEERVATERREEAERRAAAKELEKEQIEQDAAEREAQRDKQRAATEKKDKEDKAAEAERKAVIDKELAEVNQAPLIVEKSKSAVPATKNTAPKKEWQAIIVAANLVPHEYRICEPNIAAINKYAKEQKNKAQMAGVKFSEVEKTRLAWGASKGKRK